MGCLCLAVLKNHTDVWFVFLPAAPVETQAPAILALAALLILLGLLSTALLGHLLCFHIYLMWHKLTTYEYIVQHRPPQEAKGTHRELELCPPKMPPIQDKGGKPGTATVGGGAGDSKGWAYVEHVPSRPSVGTDRGSPCFLDPTYMPAQAPGMHGKAWDVEPGSKQVGAAAEEREGPATGPSPCDWPLTPDPTLLDPSAELQPGQRLGRADDGAPPPDLSGPCNQPTTPIPLGMREGPLSGAVAPKHRLVLETALLLQCPVCISQDASVSMETGAEPATAVWVLPAPPPTSDPTLDPPLSHNTPFLGQLPPPTPPLFPHLEFPPTPTPSHPCLVKLGRVLRVGVQD
ncbi:hypothetical protein P7K49_036562 [Saguinus oedipus]|uniref:Protein S-acyltransferase n=1 Tax=Saguinus oedipus TaxID=9490 RepID=A0ABQ9TKG7_SAGOE|nr:hypothetical protein P7K49_036562 [Saguinus oedipus]